MTDIREPADSGEPFRLLFVCTGNTCRSPMAAAIARRRSGERGWTRLEVRSAGVAAARGRPASGGAVRAAAAAGTKLEDHESTPLSRDLVEWADLILAMSPHHLLAVYELGGEGKASLIRAFASDGDDGRPVSDPIGADDEVYRATYDELEELIDRVFGRIEPILSP